MCIRDRYGMTQPLPMSEPGVKPEAHKAKLMEAAQKFSVKEIKALMTELGVSTEGCLDKQDLLSRLDKPGKFLSKTKSKNNNGEKADKAAVVPSRSRLMLCFVSALVLGQLTRYWLGWGVPLAWSAAWCGLMGASGVLILSLIHISEPTRLLSISYAVFCLKKKKQSCRSM
eukprot:TRINITY_DN16628_c0_g1_i6.p2 TRINITY_DN16628_c0_g1~~TRINITY_DN16628_c0_g1_i6.p2  ORF type:complete len:171 (+),score=54.52 TRINITY_DN16628_c0_g1_i6:174-686(+)